MLGRVKHPKFGHGFAISEHVSGSGKLASVVLFDFNPSAERTMLDEFLSASKSPLPEAAKATPKPKPRKKVERVPDTLIVKELDEVITGKYDLSGFEAVDSPGTV